MDDNWFEMIINISVLAVAKVLMIMALMIYLVFAIVVIRQVKAMTKVVSGQLNILLRILSWVHLLLTLAVILISIMVL